MRMPTSFLLAASLLIASAVSAQKENVPAAEIAVLPFQGGGIADRTRFDLEEALRGVCQELSGGRVQRRGETVAHVEGAGAMGVQCANADTSCLAELGRIASVRSVITTTVTGSSRGEIDLRVELIDVNSGIRQRTLEETVDRGLSGRGRDMRRIAVRLLAPESYVGALTLTSDTDGLDVLLDGKAVGTTPLAAPLEDLAPGRHSVELAHKGQVLVTRFVDVTFDRHTAVEIDVPEELLARRPMPTDTPPEIRAPTPILLGGLGGAALLGAGGGALSAGVIYLVAILRAQTDVEDGAVRDRVDEQGWYAGAFYTVAGGSVVAAAAGGALLTAAAVVE